MRKLVRHWPRLLAGCTLAAIAGGWLLDQTPWLAVGSIAACLLSARAVTRRRRPDAAADAAPHDPAADETDDDLDEPTCRRDTAVLSDMGVLIEEMLSQGRSALLMRPQIVGNLTADQLERARRSLEDGMSLTPAGEVFVHAPPTVFDDREEDERDAPLGRLVFVDGYYLDRYLVTNRQYRQFVASGGYENMSLWEPEVWPALLDLVDRTGHPGPRFWKDGKYPRGQHDHPVTGVSWYEAAAYARWVGKRLPTDAEWVKAAAWPVSLPGTRCVERAYPWGDSMDRSRVNLWGSGPGTTVSVREHAAGASVGGVYQLIGNVWEWTGGDYGSLDLDGDAGGTNLIKSLRGGAFDTYFDLQAGIQFQSGDYPLVRKHNIGFRCGLGLCDLSGSQQEGFPDEMHHGEQLAEELA